MSRISLRSSAGGDEIPRRVVRDGYLVDPLLELLINLANLAAALGGSLAVILAIGYAAAGRGVGVWGPDVLILVCLLTANAVLRAWRVRRRRVRWRRYHPGQSGRGIGAAATGDTGFSRADAENDFLRARRQQALTRLSVRGLRRRGAVNLLLLDELVTALGRQGERSLGLQSIRLDSIVGTLDRCRDFDRRFRPRSDRIRERWVQLALAQRCGEPLPPIDVYRVGEQHFVKDGHHRVSIANVTGRQTIDAYVTEVFTTTPPKGAEHRG